jgi:hypothetical protein
MNLESFGVDGVGYGISDRDRAAKFDKPALKIMFQVTQIVRFLLERGLRFRNLGGFVFLGFRGLRFRNLGFRGHELM